MFKLHAILDPVPRSTPFKTAAWVAGLCLAGAVLAPATQAQIEPSLVEPDAVLSVEEALARTLGLAPAPRRARAVAARRAGLFQQFDGAFDLRLDGAVSYEHAEGALTERAFQAEFDRREIRRILISEFTLVADDLETQLAEVDGRPVIDCRGFARLVVDGVDVCLSEFDQARAENLNELIQIKIDQAEGDPDRQEQLRQLREDQLTIVRDTYVQIIDILRQNVVTNEEALRLLGAIPEIEERDSLRVDFRLQKLLPSGVDLGFGMILDSSEDNFDGKELQSAFGGKGIPNAFTGFLGVTVDTPLGQGFGRIETEAPRRAADLNARAARLDADRAAEEAMLRTLRAYWRVAAAEESEELLGRAIESNQTLLDTAQALVDGDELAPAYLPRVRARLETARVDVARARVETARARVALLEALGVDDEIEIESFRIEALPAVPDPASIAALTAEELMLEARARRRDLTAAGLRLEASETLDRAAERALRRRVDLSFAIGWSGFYESFDDDIWEPEGFWEAFEGETTGPSITFSLSTDLPRGNRASRARLQQSRALTLQSGVRTNDLERRIDLRVARILGALQDVARRGASARAAVRDRRTTYRGASERFAVGEASVVDTVLSEEQATFAELALVEVRRQWATLVAELHAELGTYLDDGVSSRLRIETERGRRGDRDLAERDRVERGPGQWGTGQWGTGQWETAPRPAPFDFRTPLF